MAVYAKIGANKTISEEIRTFSVIPKEKIPAFTGGDPLYIGVPGSTETGQQMVYIPDSYYKTDNDSWHEPGWRRSARTGRISPTTKYSSR